MTNEIPAIPIGLKELETLEKYAMEHTLSELVGWLPYNRTQQLLTIAALRRYLLEHGLDCPFDIDVKGLTRE